MFVVASVSKLHPQCLQVIVVTAPIIAPIWAMARVLWRSEAGALCGRRATNRLIGVGREADLPALAQMLPTDEQDLTSSMLHGLSIDENRRRILLQSYWSSWASWTVELWYIFFRAAAGGRMVGIQTLKAEHFPALRLVDFSSWLVADARGKGIGIAMRTAMLALACDHLCADAAVTSAREDK